MAKKLCLILILCGWGGAQSVPEIEFRMLRSNLISGLIPDISDGYGVTFRDINNDSYPDIYLVCFRNLNRLLINNGGIIPFIDRTVYSGLGGYLMPHGQINLEIGSNTADYDNDGYPDIFLSGWGKTNRLFKNAGDVSFQDETESLNLNFNMNANQAIWVDVNNDQNLDLYICDNAQTNRLFMNRGDGSFKETPWAVGFSDTLSSQGVCAGDFDNDNDMDLYVANWHGADYLLENNGSGYFENRVLDVPPLRQKSSSNSVSAGDIDNDGDLDLVVSQLGGRLYLLENQSSPGALKYKNVINFGVEEADGDLYGVLLEDFNNDGWLDCFLSVRGKNRLYLNSGNGAFRPEYDTDNKLIYSTGAAAADLERDGDLDIFVSNKNGLSEIYLNPTNDHNAVMLKFIGVKSNHDALGTKVYFYENMGDTTKLLGLRTVNGQGGYCSSSDLPVHFGLGIHKKIEAKIYFPSGETIILNDLIPGSNMTVQELGTTQQIIFTSIKTMQYYFFQKAFWFNTILLIIYFLMLYLLVSTGIKRYRWAIVSLSARLLIWFMVSLVIFLILRTTELLTLLIVLDSFAFIGFIGSLAMSEMILSRSKTHHRFRVLLESLSNEMISIHQNRELAERLLAVIRVHPDIRGSVVGLKEADGQFEIIHNDKAPQSRRLLFNEMDFKLGPNQAWLNIDAHHPLNMKVAELNINVLFSAKAGNRTDAFLGLNMIDRNKQINNDDLRNISTIMNQMAIAIENNRYIEQSEELVKKLTENRVREKYLKELETKNTELDKTNAELTKLFRELQAKESQLVHSEKMASLGQLVAGISHELNNPISFIYANSRALQDYLAEIRELASSDNAIRKSKQQFRRLKEIADEIDEIIGDNLKGSQTVKQLVNDLKNFSRLDEADWKESSIVEGIKTSLRMLKSQISDDLHINEEYLDAPRLYCNPGQLNQVFINILSNAIQAIEGPGKISIKTFLNKDNFVIQIADTGRGIRKKNLSKIFDPFFTTKDVNQGTGLGLSICHSIVEKHDGKIEVKSVLNEGTTFTISLPVNRRRRQPK